MKKRITALLAVCFLLVSTLGMTAFADEAEVAVDVASPEVAEPIEEKAEKDKLWKIELTVPTEYIEIVDRIEVPHSYIQLSDKHTVFNFYCATPKETKAVKHITQLFDAKYFISEAKQEIL